MILYFTYGSCMEKASFDETMKKANAVDTYKNLGMAKLENHRLAFSRDSLRWGGGALDVVPSAGDCVLGVLYEVPESAKNELQGREGCPKYYSEVPVEVMHKGKIVACLTYMVIDREKEFRPTEKFLSTVIRGMRENELPPDYIERFLLHCFISFGEGLRAEEPEDPFGEAGRCIEALGHAIEGGKFRGIDREKKGKGWGGADVLITARDPHFTGGGFYPDPFLVVTDHADEVGWLFDRLKFAFRRLIDGCTKIEFYGRLARAAARSIEECRGSDERPEELLKVIVEEAAAMLQEMKERRFECLVMAPGGVIAADVKE